jgi:hypothetical protein
MLRSILSISLFSFVLFIAASVAHAQTASNGKVYWFGSVDNTLHLVISGIKIEQRIVSGQARPDGSYSFTAPLPQGETTVRVTKLEGRGTKIRVVQQPNAGNNYEAIVEIVDDGGGARDYLVEIAW